MSSTTADAGRPPLRFRPRRWPTLATLVGVAILIALGTWQLQRLAWKEGLIAEREAALSAPPEPLPVEADDWQVWEFRRVSVSGMFDHDAEQLFGLQALGGRPGHHVLTPLVREDGRAVLIDRGWVPLDRAHPLARREGQVPGEVTITGIARYRADDRPGWLTPANEPGNRTWYGYDLPALEAATGRDLLPVVVEAGPDPNPGGLPVGGQTRIELPNRHLQYVVTWYGLALTLIGVYLAFSLERKTPDR
jgi:surfeit locus 1 family protein